MSTSTLGGTYYELGFVAEGPFCVLVFRIFTLNVF